MEGSGLEAVSERGSAEGKNRTAVAAGNDNDIEMDSGSVKDGDMDACDQPALPPEKVNLCQYSGPVLDLQAQNADSCGKTFTKSCP